MCTNVVINNGYNMAEKIDKSKKRHKKYSKKVSHEDVAYTVGASKSTVKAIRNGNRSNETDLGQRVQIAEMLIEDGQNKLLEEVKRIVQIPAI